MQSYTNHIAAYYALENARRIIVACLPLATRLASGASPTLGASSALGSRLALGAYPTLGARPF